MNKIIAVMCIMVFFCGCIPTRGERYVSITKKYPQADIVMVSSLNYYLVRTSCEIRYIEVNNVFSPDIALDIKVFSIGERGE